MTDQHAIFCHGDDARLLADHDGDGVRVFGNAQAGAVASAHVLAQIQIIGKRQKIEKWDYADLKEMCNMEAVEEFRKKALNPENPKMRGSHENGDVFFQHRRGTAPGRR